MADLLPMPRTVSFSVAGAAKPKGSWRALPNWKTGRVQFLPDNANSKDWHDQVAFVARQTQQTMLAGPLVLIVTFYLPRPKRHALPFPTGKPDIDKLVRNVADALTGVLYLDDAQIVDVIAFKRYAPVDPLTTITVSQQLEMEL
jgi:Holliday junction resolvase RusA-like endonuclease